MFLIIFAFFCVAFSDAARVDATEAQKTAILWNKLSAYQNATGISSEEMTSIWEKSRELSQKRTVRG